MKSLHDVLLEAKQNKTAVGHFNISDLLALQSIFEAAQELQVPVVIGTSEGESKFIGQKMAVTLIRHLRETYDYPIFLNADHFRSLEAIKRAVEAGYDSVIFDAAKLSLEENIKATKEVVEYARATRPEVVVEGELGYIGTASEVQKEIPAGAALKEEDLTSPEDAARYVQETGIDLLAPAVGNVHGIIVAAGFTERLNVERVRAIASAVSVPLVLHGASGLPAEDFTAGVAAGISLVHINTELRVAWRKGLEVGLAENPDEVAPYKILPPARDLMKRLVLGKLRLFSGL